MATRAEVERFAKALGNVRKLTIADAERLFQTLKISDPTAAAKALVADLPKIVGQYGELSAAVAADWYDELRATSGAPGRYTAVMTDPVATAAVQANARWVAAPLFGDPGDLLGRLKQVAERMALQGARDTISLNTGRDNARPTWARVPVGKTCAFCTLLASRGAVYTSRESAGGGHRWHSDCDCTPTPQWPGQDYPSGYNPDVLYQQYLDARSAAGSSSAPAVLSKLREQQNTN